MSNEIIANNARAVGTPVNRQVDTRPVKPAASDGNVTPQGGNTLPAKTTIELPEIDFERALENLNQFMRDNNRDLQFRVDEGTGRTVITVFNAATDEVVRQIPAEEVLAMARRLQDQGVQIFSAII